jgi:hypothetical protein
MRFTAFILTVGLTLSFTISFGQEKTKLVNEIRKEVKAIDSDTTQKKVVLNNEEFLEHATDGGGQLAGFYKAGQLRKIVRWVGLSNGNEIVDFYFKSNKLIFVHDQFNSFVYDRDKQTVRFDTTEKTFDGRYYFYNNKLIDQISTGHNRFEDDSIDAEKTWLAEANDNKKLLGRKKKKSR